MTVWYQYSNTDYWGIKNIENNSNNIVTYNIDVINHYILHTIQFLRCYFKTDCTQTVWSFFAFASNTLAMCRALTSGGRGRRKLGSQTPRSPRCDPMASSHSLRDKTRPISATVAITALYSSKSNRSCESTETLHDQWYPKCVKLSCASHFTSNHLCFYQFKLLKEWLLDLAQQSFRLRLASQAAHVIHHVIEILSIVEIKTTCMKHHQTWKLRVWFSKWYVISPSHNLSPVITGLFMIIHDGRISLLNHPLGWPWSTGSLSIWAFFSAMA